MFFTVRQSSKNKYIYLQASTKGLEYGRYYYHQV